MSSEMDYDEMKKGLIAASVCACVFFTALAALGIKSIIPLTKKSHSMGPALYSPKQSITLKSGAKFGHHSHFFKSKSTGLWIFHHSWTVEPNKEKGKFFISHGFGEHGARYSGIAAVLNHEGYSVHAIDHQGHGRSEGDRVYFERLEHVISDVIQWLEECHDIHPINNSSSNNFFLGHSMGGLIALHVARTLQLKGGFPFKGLILSAPGLAFDPKLDNAINRGLVKLLSNILPKLPVEPLNIKTVCSDEVIQSTFMRDPLNYKGGVRVRVGYEVINAVDQVQAFAHELTMPVLIVHSENDILCNISGSRKFMESAVNCKSKTLLAYGKEPGQTTWQHEMFNEEGGELVIDDIIDWMQKQ